MKTFEQVLLESCTKIVYSEAKGILTEGVQVAIIKNLYSEGIKDWFLRKVRRLKTALYHNADREEITNATVDTFFKKDSDTGKIDFRKEVLDCFNKNGEILKKDPLVRKLDLFRQEYNKTRNLGFFGRLFGGKSRLKLDALSDLIVQTYMAKWNNNGKVPFDPSKTAYKDTRMGKASQITRAATRAARRDFQYGFPAYEYADKNGLDTGVASIRSIANDMKKNSYGVLPSGNLANAGTFNNSDSSNKSYDADSKDWLWYLHYRNNREAGKFKPGSPIYTILKNHKKKKK